jgi:hypothetical protein
MKKNGRYNQKIGIGIGRSELCPTFAFGTPYTKTEVGESYNIYMMIYDDTYI